MVKKAVAAVAAKAAEREAPWTVWTLARVVTSFSDVGRCTGASGGRAGFAWRAVEREEAREEREAFSAWCDRQEEADRGYRPLLDDRPAKAVQTPAPIPGLGRALTTHGLPAGIDPAPFPDLLWSTEGDLWWLGTSRARGLPGFDGA